jgi:hypothetical protein
MAVAIPSDSEQPRAHHRAGPRIIAAVTIAAAVATTSGTRYSTLGA